MGGRYAVTNDDDADAFDPRPVKVGDVLWTLFWHHDKYHDFDEPTLYRATVTKVEQTEMHKIGDRVEETWVMETEELSPRYFKINAFSPSYRPYFWTSREDAEAAAREAMKEQLGYIEEEFEEIKAKIADCRTKVDAPIEVREEE